ncbi:Protein CBG12174 [Caenorhabditis briggsae]|uniref:Protein CBG12174 n=1 Tax=Caenorhabditis briggsae TaxID=6238 RepID=A8XF26_CAEBR|nr:Protein CBG12174 [Caenorhabditis briggsae]CAP31248.2 Protein CBG12174 [Caenorhabditis briggsae]
MHHNEYNWYSTSKYSTVINPLINIFSDTTNRFQRMIVRERPYPQQYSDEGRYPLGRTTDPESLKMRSQLTTPLQEKTLQKWAAHQKEMADQCLLRKRQLGLRHEDSDPSWRTYPEKRTTYEEDDHETQGGSDASQPSWNEYDRSKYVLNRKVNPPSVTHSHSSPHSTADSDQIFVDGEKVENNLKVGIFKISDSQPSTTQMRWVVSGKENNDKHVSSSDNNTSNSSETTASSPDRPLRKSVSVTTDRGPTLIVTVPSVSENGVEECILNKYGHCFAPTICPFSHNGSVKSTKGKKITAPSWPLKLPDTNICSGYLNFQCWDYNCEKRHVVYPSDNVDSQ